MGYVTVHVTVLPEAQALRPRLATTGGPIVGLVTNG